MALREADKPSPNRGYAKRTPDLEASDNALFPGLFTLLPVREILGTSALTEFYEVR